MKSTELRIGNYLQDAKEKLAPVEGLSKNKIKAYSGMVTEMPLKPIPLTEEWLLKFENIPWISKDKSGVFYWFNGEKKYIKFVHTLQNTYFCIEQKELLCKDTETLNI